MILSPLLWLADHAASIVPGADLTATYSLMGKAQSTGFLWSDWVTSPSFPPSAGSFCGGIHYQRLPVHGVDIGTGLMQEGHFFRSTHDKSRKVKARKQLAALMKKHGQANGLFGANECLSDRDPTHGTETCVVVEMMESLGQLFQETGEMPYLDQLEKIALNAMGAPFFNGTMGAMKYFQEVDHPHADTYSQVLLLLLVWVVVVLLLLLLMMCCRCTSAA